MSKIKNGGLDQYGAEPFEQQQFGISGVEGVNCCKYQRTLLLVNRFVFHCSWKLKFNNIANVCISYARISRFLLQ